MQVQMRERNNKDNKQAKKEVCSSLRMQRVPGGQAQSQIKDFTRVIHFGTRECRKSKTGSIFTNDKKLITCTKCLKIVGVKLDKKSIINGGEIKLEYVLGRYEAKRPI